MVVPREAGEGKAVPRFPEPTWAGLFHLVYGSPTDQRNFYTYLERHTKNLTIKSGLN